MKMIANNLYFNAVSEIGNESYSIDSSGDLHFFANVNKSFEDTYFSDSFVMEIASNSLLFYRDNKNLSKFN